MTSQQWLTEVNNERKSNKNQWIFRCEYVDGKQVYLKSFNTYIQRYKVDDIDHTPPMGLNVGQWKTALIAGLQYVDKVNADKLKADIASKSGINPDNLIVKVIK